MKDKKGKFKEKITRRFRLVIFNESSFEERFSLKITRLHIYVFAILWTVLIIAIAISVIIYTPLNEYLPGVSSSDLRRKTIVLSKQVDSLQGNIYKLESFIGTIKPLLLGNVQNLKKPLPHIEPLTIHEDANGNTHILEGLEGYKKTIASLQKKIQKKDEIVEKLNQHIHLTQNYATLDSMIPIPDMDFRKKVESEERFSIRDFKTSKKTMHFIAPVTGTITEGFNRKDKHYAVDVAVDKHTPIKAIANGVVIFTQWTMDAGYVIMIMHLNGYVSVYKHNYILNKQQGDIISAGEVIGASGSVDHFSTGPHLHFELWYKNYPVNPIDFINFEL